MFQQLISKIYPPTNQTIQQQLNLKNFKAFQRYLSYKIHTLDPYVNPYGKTNHDIVYNIHYTYYPAIDLRGGVIQFTLLVGSEYLSERLIIVDNKKGMLTDPILDDQLTRIFNLIEKAKTRPPKQYRGRALLIQQEIVESIQETGTLNTSLIALRDQFELEDLERTSLCQTTSNCNSH